jgi:ATP-binding cassette subfamily B protein
MDKKAELKKVSERQAARRGPGMGPMPMSVEKPKHFKKTLGQLARHLKPYFWQIICTVIFAVASTIFTIVTPRILGNMTNQIVDDYIAIKTYDVVMENLPPGVTLPSGTTGETILAQMPDDVATQIPADQLDKIKALDLSQQPVMHYEILAQTAFILIALYLLSALFGYIQGWIITGVTQKVTFTFRRKISEKINRLPIKYFDKHSYGDVLSRVTNDVDTISQSLSQSLSQIITAITTLIGITVMMLTISWQMTGIAILVVPLSLIFVMLITKRSQKYFKKQQASLGELNGHIEEIYSGHNVVKAFSGEARAARKFRRINGQLHGSGWKSQFLSGLMMPIMQIVGNLGYVGVAVTGGWLAVNGRISIGDIQAFIQYVSNFNQPIMQTAQVANILQSTVAAAERVFEFLDEQEEEPDPTVAQKLEKVRGAVDFDNIIFGYTSEKTIIKNFSAHVKPGQRVAIVGPTGAGKTTIVNLLMRFYDPQSGVIKIDGVNTRDMRRADVRREFGMVLQDTWLFNGTIRENLAYGDLNANDDQITAAARAARVDHFIHSLPQGYDTILDENAENISAGEKQLLTIARAMLADAPMLILDEATSSVDTRTEVLIQAAMDELMRGRTSFVIAHRLSTIRGADLILVMNEGHIVEQGTHDQLLAANGFYAKLYNAQFTEA